MWTVKPTAMPVQFFRGRTGTVSVEYPQPPPRNYDVIRRRFCNFSKKSQTSEAQSAEGSGQTILLRSENSNDSKPFSKEMSGSDVLLAIQKARAQRKRSIAGKKKTTKITDMKLSSTANESTGDNGVDVRPLRIKSEWGHKLEEFEKLLKEFQDTEL